jgi:hypothetical protein
VTSDRDNFTQHGLHLNRKGKEEAAKTTANSIREIFKLQKDPINELEEGANTITMWTRQLKVICRKKF